MLIGCILFAILAIIIIIEGISFSLGLHFADVRGIEHKDIFSYFFIPFGFLHIRKLGESKYPYLKKRVESPKGIAATCIKWTALGIVLFVGFFLILWNKNFLLNVIGWMILGLLVLVNMSVSSTLAFKKGLSPFLGGLFGLIPFASTAFYCISNGKKRILPDTVYNTFKFKEIALRVVIYCELVVLCFIVLIPIVYLLGSALTNNSNSIPNDIWPSKIYWGNFEILFKQIRYKTINEKPKEIKVWYLYWFRNTFLVALFTMVFSVLFITVTAYIFSRFKFKGQKAGLLVMLILNMFPTFLSLIAIYQLLKLLGLLNNPYALVVTYTSGAIPYNVWLIKGFLQNIPKDLDESATIDGANRLQIFFRIILPLIVPILTFVAVNQFMAPWLDYILPSYVLKAKNAEEQKNWTIAVGLFNFINTPGADLYQPTLFCAGALIIALPIAVLYVVFQRYLIEGITAGATKG